MRQHCAMAREVKKDVLCSMAGPVAGAKSDSCRVRCHSAIFPCTWAYFFGYLYLYLGLPLAVPGPHTCLRPCHCHTN